MLSATPNAGHVFLDWRESGVVQSTAPDYVFTGLGDRTLVAHFLADGDALFASGFDPPSRAR